MFLNDNKATVYAGLRFLAILRLNRIFALSKKSIKKRPINEYRTFLFFLG